MGNSPDKGDSTATLDEQLAEAIIATGDTILRYFKHGHLPPQLQAKSAPFAVLALQIVREYPRNPERTMALRKILEGKDCAVRAALPE